MTTPAGEEEEVVVDALLRNRAYYIKRSPQGTGQINWKKHGGPANAWVKTMEQAVRGRVVTEDP